MSEQTERERFEAWLLTDIQGRGYSTDLWCAWQAGAKRVEELTAENAELRKDAMRWREIDKLAADPEFKLKVNAGGWAFLTALADSAMEGEPR